MYLLENVDNLEADDLKALRLMRGRIKRYDKIYDPSNKGIEELIYMSTDLFSEVGKLDKLMSGLSEYLSNKGLSRSLLQGDELIGMMAKDRAYLRDKLNDIDDVIVKWVDRRQLEEK